MTFLLSGLYISFFAFHQEMIPTELIKSVSRSREELPSPIFLEMIVLEFAFEILREAGVRLPRPVGQAVSIVGALVIGQAAVAAKLVSPPSIIVVALVAIASFTIPFFLNINNFSLENLLPVMDLFIPGEPEVINFLDGYFPFYTIPLLYGLPLLTVIVAKLRGKNQSTTI